MGERVKVCCFSFSARYFRGGKRLSLFDDLEEYEKAVMG